MVRITAQTYYNFGDSLFQNWSCVIKSRIKPVCMNHASSMFQQEFNQGPGYSRRSVLSAILNWHCKECEQLIKNIFYIPMEFWPFYYQWKWMKPKEHGQTRVPKPLPAEIKRWRIQEWISNVLVQIEFYWYQNIVCWNISHWHSRGTNLQNSRVQVYP